MNLNLSKVKTMAVVLALAAAASAQFSLPANARIAGMAGAPTADISRVFDYPALMMGYNEHLQATFGSPLFGTAAGGFIGVKSVTETFSIGILANQGLVTDSVYNYSFRDAATSWLNASVVGPMPGIGQGYNGYNIPHLLLGFNAGAFRFGADIFFECAAYNEHTEDGSAESSRKGIIMHPGARLSAETEVGEVGILAKVGIGVPWASGEYSGGGSAASDGSDKGLYMELGGEAVAPLVGLDWTLGASYTFSDHKQIDNDMSYWNSVTRFYLSCEFNVLETAVAAAGYTFVRSASTENSSASNTSDMNGAHLHTFAAGMENIWDDIWILDAFALRAGARYRITADVVAGTAPSFNSGTAQPGVHTAVVPYMGVGVSKGFLTLDLALSMNQWGGLFSGPPVGLATATVKF